MTKCKWTNNFCEKYKTGKWFSEGLYSLSVLVVLAPLLKRGPLSPTKTLMLQGTFPCDSYAEKKGPLSQLNVSDTELKRLVSILKIQQKIHKFTIQWVPNEKIVIRLGLPRL